MNKLIIIASTSSILLAAAAPRAGAKILPPPKPYWWNVEAHGGADGKNTELGSSADATTAAALSKLGIDSSYVQLGSSPYWNIGNSAMTAECSGLFGPGGPDLPNLVASAWDLGGAGNYVDYNVSVDVLSTIQQYPQTYTTAVWVTGMQSFGSPNVQYGWTASTPGTHTFDQTIPLPAPELTFTGHAFDFPDAQVDAVGTASTSVTASAAVTQYHVDSSYAQRTDVSYAIHVHVPETGDDHYSTLVVMRDD